MHRDCQMRRIRAAHHDRSHLPFDVGILVRDAEVESKEFEFEFKCKAGSKREKTGPSSASQQLRMGSHDAAFLGLEQVAHPVVQHALQGPV